LWICRMRGSAIWRTDRGVVAVRADVAVVVLLRNHGERLRTGCGREREDRRRRVPSELEPAPRRCGVEILAGARPAHQVTLRVVVPRVRAVVDGAVRRHDRRRRRVVEHDTTGADVESSSTRPDPGMPSGGLTFAGAPA